MTTIKFKKFNIEAYKPGKSNIKRLKKIVPKNYEEINKINHFVRLKTLKLSIR